MRNIKILPILPVEIEDIKALPLIHKDPFDKILICQAKTENMRLMTHDSLLPFYKEPCILCVQRQLTDSGSLQWLEQRGNRHCGGEVITQFYQH